MQHQPKPNHRVTIIISRVRERITFTFIICEKLSIPMMMIENFYSSIRQKVMRNQRDHDLSFLPFMTPWYFVCVVLVPIIVTIHDDILDISDDDDGEVKPWSEEGQKVFLGGLREHLWRRKRFNLLCSMISVSDVSLIPFSVRFLVIPQFFFIVIRSHPFNQFERKGTKKGSKVKVKVSLYSLS